MWNKAVNKLRETYENNGSNSKYVDNKGHKNYTSMTKHVYFNLN